MAASFQDGSNAYGSVVITIGTLGYVAENFTQNVSTNVIEVKDRLGEPSGMIAIPGFVSGSATVQLATATYPIPTLGAVFTYVFTWGHPWGNNTITYVVAGVGLPMGQSDLMKVNIDFRKRINS